MAINFEAAKSFSNGVRVLNCTPHSINFLDNGDLVVVEPSGATLKATAVETDAGTAGAARLVKTVFQTSPEGLAELAEIEAALPGVLVVGSIISAQAYPGRVVGMTPAAGFERVPPAEKRMDPGKFTLFEQGMYIPAHKVKDFLKEITWFEGGWYTSLAQELNSFVEGLAR